MTVCSILFPTGPHYLQGRSWAEVRDYARYRYGVRDDDVQHRPAGAPEGAAIEHVAGALNHDERRADEARGVANAAFAAGYRDAMATVITQWETMKFPDEFFTWLREQQ